MCPSSWKLYVDDFPFLVPLQLVQNPSQSCLKFGRSTFKTNHHHRQWHQLPNFKHFMAIFALATLHIFQGGLVILLSLHAKTLHSLIKIFQDSLDFGRIRGVLEDRRRKVIVRQVLSQIWKMYLFIIPHICHFFTHAKFLENKIYTKIYTVNCQFFALNL